MKLLKLNKIILAILILGLFIFLSNKQIKADYCAGGWDCGMTINICKPTSTCENNTWMCDAGVSPCYWGTWCDPAGVRKNCEGDWEYACEVAGIGCGIGYCGGPFNVSCTWVVNNPTPPPGPTPTPEPPPVGGNCNTDCGTCGYKRNDGSCTTDNSCCHRTCSGGNCITVSGNGNNACDNNNDCNGGSDPTGTLLGRVWVDIYHDGYPNDGDLNNVQRPGYECNDYRTLDGIYINWTPVSSPGSDTNLSLIHI